ncbi:MAG: hypothetical protein ACLUW6_00755 [Coriobacteriaceae bacterium]
MTEYESVIRRPGHQGRGAPRARVLVGVERPGLPWPLNLPGRAERLADTAGADVVATTTQRLTRPTRAPSSARASRRNRRAGTVARGRPRHLRR